MITKIITGEKPANKIIKKVLLYSNDIFNKIGRKPNICIIYIGSNILTDIYIKNKINDCNKTNIGIKILRLSNNIKENKVIDIIKKLNDDNLIDGILIQLPIPNHINFKNIILYIDPNKDIDGLHPNNIGYLFYSFKNIIYPPTAKAILYILKYYKINTIYKNITVLGRGKLVGRPISILLSQNREYGNSTVTQINKLSKNKMYYIKNSDIVISATGNNKIIKRKMIKKGCTLINVGMSKIKVNNKYKIVGDINIKKMLGKAKFIVPVLNGIGPITRAILLFNVILLINRNI